MIIPTIHYHIIRYLLLTAGSWLLSMHYLVGQPTPQLFPLHTFFQANYDSTIIYQSSSTRNNSPNYLILAKYQDKVYFFMYTSPYRVAEGRYFPGELSKKFAQGELAFSRMPPDTNRYLLPTTAAPTTLAHCWRNVAPSQLWQVRDDQRRLNPQGNCILEDGDENMFYLIDKRAIRTAYFYAPAYFEECEGKKLNRQLAIKAITALRALTQ
ncbi:hypothetical protein HMJ29_12970 [Hymenobacter taeanensis]|uniref:Uncharacterized protein n=1 Tax=Hymenobacter taeanensis TaxID=2735321 RepID=A0A6M6BJ19_9BACT|nr:MULTISPECIES: hypothetical protein [Hymenobacter]QJX47804.1 hypothetical protein HMJ29_12970 [Hymenobacter taeanensis]UOQ82708.1 hypothetical protein MUN83_08095 [Hymenobacter sp. 5414T-23]